ncbi:helix-turn-helix domain-containing protein [Paracoccus sp. Z330]|uniref:Helix-turn-helix domain-containing protein n=1 Tax=Paracoccus onchidii TaxID=3017813 RepID=A0ABT4ZGZ5_9RHOB|nr:helix-turn-helix domain-containing protein [Paracoccus onchidii]MDB6178634.1 helix-turn-helix domain-containing protein [Paracoccus onchidii]
MEKNDALLGLSALAHEIRLDVFRLLIQAGPQGLTAGDLARLADIRPNTLSNNLNILSAADLVRSSREGRSVRYFAQMDTMRDLLGFLLQDCCGGQVELCQSFLDQIACDC